MGHSRLNGSVSYTKAQVNIMGLQPHLHLLPLSVLIRELTFLPEVSVLEVCPSDISGVWISLRLPCSVNISGMCSSVIYQHYHWRKILISDSPLSLRTEKKCFLLGKRQVCFHKWLSWFSEAANKTTRQTVVMFTQCWHSPTGTTAVSTTSLHRGHRQLSDNNSFG